jgi:hypothetical protein
MDHVDRAAITISLFGDGNIVFLFFVLLALESRILFSSEVTSGKIISFYFKSDMRTSF